MTKKLGVLVAMFVALGSIELGVPAASAKDHEVPFRGFYSGTAAFADATLTTVLFSGAGSATHLGNGESDGKTQIVGLSAGSCPGGVDGLENHRTETLTAANGDTLTLESDDVACPLDPNGFTFHGTGHWTVTGGTGRFSGATGHGTTDGGGDFIQGTFFLQLTGVISAPNGK